MEQQLIQEIREITQQYQQEVPGSRKSWPNSVKQRVDELAKRGLSFKKISEETGIPYGTVMKWRDSFQGEFKKVSTVSVPTFSETLQPIQSEPVSTLTVTTPSGLRVQGLQFEQLVQLLGVLK